MEQNRVKSKQNGAEFGALLESRMAKNWGKALHVMHCTSVPTRGARGYSGFCGLPCTRCTLIWLVQYISGWLFERNREQLGK